MKGLADCLKRGRESLGMTQKEVADEIGVKDFTTLSHWENDNRLKYHRAFIKMCVYYGLSMDDVANAIDEDDRNPESIAELRQRMGIAAREPHTEEIDAQARFVSDSEKKS